MSANAAGDGADVRSGVAAATAHRAAMAQPLDLLDAAVREVREHLRVDRLLAWALDCEPIGGV